MDEAEEFELLARQHRWLFSGRLGNHGTGSETKHEHTLSVRYVFRNLLICDEQSGGLLKPQLNDAALAAGHKRRGMRFPNQQAVGLG